MKSFFFKLLTFYNLTDCFQGAVRKNGCFPASGYSRASIAPVAPDFENKSKILIFMLQMKGFYMDQR